MQLAGAGVATGGRPTLASCTLVGPGGGNDLEAGGGGEDAGEDAGVAATGG